jgi:hypothetical protein
MPTYELNQGENAILRFNLFQIEDTDTFLGDWNAITAFVANNVVMNDSVAYRCILAHTNHEPPNATYWEVMTSVSADDVKEARVDLVQDGEIALSFKYKAGAAVPANVSLEDSIFEVELLKSQSMELSGLYDVRFELTVKDDIYIASGSQTNTTCIDDALNVVPC